MLCGSNPLRAIRQKRKGMEKGNHAGMEKHRGENFLEMLAKFSTYMQPSMLSDVELAKRKKVGGSFVRQGITFL